MTINKNPWAWEIQKTIILKRCVKCLGCSSSAAGLLGRFSYYKNFYKGVCSVYDNSPVKIYVDSIQKEEVQI